MATTSKLGDFLGRALVNNNPGTSNATDYLGRGVAVSDKDWLGRALQNTATYPPADRAVNTAYSVGDTRKIAGIKEVQTLTATGTPAGTLKINVTLHGTTAQSGAIAVGSISAANISTALIAASNVEPGDITVGGTGPWTLTFESEEGDVGLATADNTAVTAGTYAITNTTTGAKNEQIIRATVAGTSHASNPVTPPAVGATVVDGTVTWVRLK